MVFDFEKLTLQWLIQVGFNQKLLKPSKFSFKVIYFDTFSDIPKGQLISKCPDEKSVSTKYQRKYF